MDAKKGRRGKRSIHSIPAFSRVNRNTPVRGTGWRGPKDGNWSTLEGAAIREKPKSKEKDVQTKDVEKAIKTCNVIVEKWKR
jgi:hypothetical protein